MAVFNVTDDLKVHGTITDQGDSILSADPTVEVSKNSAAAVGIRRTLNFIEGTNITLIIAEDVGGDEIDVTIAASGGATVDEIWDETDTAHTTTDSFGKTLRDLADELIVTKQLGFGSFEGAPLGGQIAQPLSGSSSGTFGSIIQLLASTAFKTRAIALSLTEIHAENGTTARFSFMTGAATSEVELIQQMTLRCKDSTSTGDRRTVIYYLPVEIPSGTRIGIKVLDSSSSQLSYQVSAVLMGD